MPCCCSWPLLLLRTPPPQTPSPDRRNWKTLKRTPHEALFTHNVCVCVKCQEWVLWQQVKVLTHVCIFRVRSHLVSTFAPAFALNFNTVSMAMLMLIERMSREHDLSFWNLLSSLLLFLKTQTQTLTLSVNRPLNNIPSLCYPRRRILGFQINVTWQCRLNLGSFSFVFSLSVRTLIWNCTQPAHTSAIGSDVIS